MNNLDLNESDIDLLIEALDKLPSANDSKMLVDIMIDGLMSENMTEEQKFEKKKEREKEQYAAEIEKRLLKDRISITFTKLNVMKMNMNSNSSTQQD